MFVAADRPGGFPPGRLRTPSPGFPRNRSRHGGRHRVRLRNQKSRVMSPQSATPTSISDHSEGFNPNSLPSLITYVIICMYSVLTRCTVATVDGGGCSAQVTDRMNLLPKAGTKTPGR
jgi:hypothetical protein